MGKIYYLMGKSASGKDTLYNRILAEKPELRTYVMYTTRPKREGEADGAAYHFTTEEAIRGYEAAGTLIEKRIYHTVMGPWIYATVDDGQIDLADGDYLMPGTLESYLDVREYFGSEKLIPIYVEVEDGERLMRAIRREQQQEVPKYKEMCRRFLADSEDFSEEKLAAAGIVQRFNNADIGACVTEILSRMEEERK